MRPVGGTGDAVDPELRRQVTDGCPVLVGVDELRDFAGEQLADWSAEEIDVDARELVRG